MQQPHVAWEYEEENARLWKDYDGVNNTTRRVGDGGLSGEWTTVKRKSPLGISAKKDYPNPVKLSSAVPSTPKNNQWQKVCYSDQNCRNAGCKYGHRSRTASPNIFIYPSQKCKNGVKCLDAKCRKAHPSPAKAPPVSEGRRQAFTASSQGGNLSTTSKTASSGTLRDNACLHGEETKQNPFLKQFSARQDQKHYPTPDQRPYFHKQGPGTPTKQCREDSDLIKSTRGLVLHAPTPQAQALAKKKVIKISQPMRRYPVPPGFDMRKEHRNAKLALLAEVTGTIMRISESNAEIHISGNDEQITKAIHELETWIIKATKFKEPQNLSKQAKEMRYPRIRPHDENRIWEEEIKAKRESIKEQYRTVMLPPGQQLDFVEIIEIPTTNTMSSETLFGTNHERLDIIKRETRTVIMPRPNYAQNILVLEITAINQERVGIAVARIQSILKNIYASDFESPTIRELQNPAPSGQIEFTLTDHLSVGHMGGGNVTKEGLSLTLKSAPRRPPVAQYDPKPLRSALQLSIEQMKYYKGIVHIRARYGTFVLTKYPRDFPGRTFTPEDLSEYLMHENAKSKLVNRPLSPSILNILDSAKGLFVCKNPPTSAESRPTTLYEALFIVKHRESNVSYKLALAFEHVGSEIDRKASLWSKINSTQACGHCILDIAMINMSSNSSAWSLEANTTEFLSRVPKCLLEFSENLVVPSRRPISMRSAESLPIKFKSSPEVQVVSGSQSAVWQYGIRKTPLTVKVRQEVSFNANTPSKQPESFYFRKPEWCLEVTSDEWYSLLHENATRMEGFQASWEPSIRTFFPIEGNFDTTQSTETREDGLQFFLDHIAKVEHVINNGILSEEDRRAPPLVSRRLGCFEDTW